MSERFNVLMCKFYKFYIRAIVGIIIQELDYMHGVTMKISMHIAKRFNTACIISKVLEGCFETLHV